MDFLFDNPTVIRPSAKRTFVVSRRTLSRTRRDKGTPMPTTDHQSETAYRPRVNGIGLYTGDDGARTFAAVIADT